MAFLGVRNKVYGISVAAERLHACRKYRQVDNYDIYDKNI